MALEKEKLEELLSGETIEVLLKGSLSDGFKVQKKLLGYFVPSLSELFEVTDLERIDLRHANEEGAKWLAKWIHAGGQDETGKDLEPDTADSAFVDSLLSRVVAATDLGVDQAKDETLGTLYKFLNKNRFTREQFRWIGDNTTKDFGEDLAKQLPQLFSGFEAMERALDSITILRDVKDAQRSKPLPVHKLRFLYKYVGGRGHLGPVIAASLWQLIHDGKVQNIEIYHAFAAENGSFEEDMELAFKKNQAQDGDTGALQKTWNDQVYALRMRSMEEIAKREDPAGYRYLAWHPSGFS